MLAAKTVVSASSAAVAAFVMVAAAGELVRLTLGDHAAAGASGPATAARAALIVGVDAVLVVGLAAMVRHSVGALACSFVLFVATLALPSGVAIWAPAGASAAFLTNDAASYPAVVGLVVTAAWAAAIYAAGMIVLRRRDA
jgi:hypothetical protein